MAYQAQLASGTTLFVEQQDKQTVLRLHGGHQDQSVSFTTGRWTSAPRLLQNGDDTYLELHGDQMQVYAVRDGGLQSLEAAPKLDGAKTVDWKEVPDGSDKDAQKPMEPMKPMEGMKPMEPMKPMKPM